MKKLLLLLLVLIYSTSIYAQNCGGHHIYNIPHGTTPKVYDKLGTAPQFVPLRHTNSEGDFYRKLKALSHNRRYNNEMNNLLRSLGYTGVDDPAFDREDVEHVKIPFGAMGMLGEAGHRYQYAMIAIPNQSEVDAWRINAKNGNCRIYIMSECGNAFYYTNETPTTHKCPECKHETAGIAKVKIKVYKMQSPGGYCADSWCDDCDYIDRNTGNYTSRAKKYRPQKVLIAEETIDNIPAAGKQAEYTPEKVIVVEQL